jgi:hypothetical protein
LAARVRVSMETPWPWTGSTSSFIMLTGTAAAKKLRSRFAWLNAAQ